MEITRQADYAVRAMIHLGSVSPDTRVSSAAISRAQRVPLPFLTKVIAQLVHAGLVTTSRGMGGGVSLTRNPEDITLLDILEAVEGPITLNRCLLRGITCELEEHCAVHDVWAEIQKHIVEDLKQVSLAYLVQAQAAKSAGRPFELPAALVRA
ncbi:MAG: RrF2 family transcriptional regulator [Anaerolineae bacterium]